MHRRRRVAVIALLLACTLGLCVHYGAAYDRNWPHPTGDQLAEDPDGWDGEPVLLFGEVQEQTPEGLVMTVENDSETIVRTVTVHGTTVDVEPGGVVQVHGRLAERGTVQEAESVVVVNRSPEDNTYKLLASLLSGLVAAGCFLRYWRIDIWGLRFVSREGEGDG